jgi:hypothetical protein
LVGQDHEAARRWWLPDQPAFELGAVDQIVGIEKLAIPPAPAEEGAVVMLLGRSSLGANVDAPAVQEIPGVARPFGNATMDDQLSGFSGFRNDAPPQRPRLPCCQWRGWCAPAV